MGVLNYDGCPELRHGLNWIRPLYSLLILNAPQNVSTSRDKEVGV